MKKEIIQRVRIDISREDIKKDAERYCELAVQLGATDAKVVSSNQIIVDERVVLKCRVPKCFGYGTGVNCPPYCLKPEEMRNLVKMYSYGVVLKLEVPPSVIVRDKATITERVEAYKKVFNLVNSIESEAFYNGYYLATGFAAGSCKSTFCYKVECTVLKGEKCRLNLRVRPSMEAVGVDCYRLAATMGWDIYPIGSSASPESVPHGTLMGLLLVA